MTLKRYKFNLVVQRSHNESTYLACQYKPKIDMGISYQKKWLATQIVLVEQLDTNIFEVFIENTHNIVGGVGQYIELAFPDDIAISRRYSLVTCSPTKLSIHVQYHVFGSVSSRLTSMGAGRDVLITTPRGSYVLPSNAAHYSRVYAVANGTGMGVTLSLLANLKHNSQVIIVSVSRKEKLSSCHKKLYSTYIKQHPSAKIMVSSIDGLFNDKAIMLEHGSLFFVCGSPELNQRFLQKSVDLKSRDSHVIQEQF